MDAQTSLFSLSTTFSGPAAAESTLINALARFGAKTSECDAARDRLKTIEAGPAFEAAHAEYKRTHEALRDEAFRVVGAAEAALMQLKTR